MDFYAILGVPQEASTADIKRAYRRLARRYHPGVNPGDRAAEEIFERIVEAYETLVDPGRRRQYDTAGAHGAPAVGIGVVHVRRVRFFRREARPAGVDVHASCSPKSCIRCRGRVATRPKSEPTCTRR